jgi:2-polyprenyl-6-methoxyphenol hydroxylase-like FAD-dependent oxidoreductase
LTIEVLITGASVAGNALAWWRGRDGAEVTVVERAPAFRDGGHNVAVRSVCPSVLRTMRLRQAALALGPDALVLRGEGEKR